MVEYYPQGFGEHVIRFTFQWDRFKLVKEGKMGGNCKGFSIIESVLDDVVSEIFGEDDWCEITMYDDDGLDCECEFDSEEELKDALVAVEIVSWTPEKD